MDEGTDIVLRSEDQLASFQLDQTPLSPLANCAKGAAVNCAKGAPVLPLDKALPQVCALRPVPVDGASHGAGLGKDLPG